MIRVARLGALWNGGVECNWHSKEKSQACRSFFFLIPTGINSNMFKRLCGGEKIWELKLIIFHPREWYNNNKIKKKRMVVISLVQNMETQSQIVLCLFNLMSTGDSYNMIQFNPYGTLIVIILVKVLFKLCWICYMNFIYPLYFIMVQILG